MKKQLAMVVSVGLLAGCATILEGQTQPMTIVTPGAEGAECILQNEDMRYKVRAGETNTIMKSNHDLNVECLAPGNRQRKVVVAVELEPATLANVTNAVVPGTTYDHFSRGMYSYPETVVVDFKGIAAKSYPLPGYMNQDVSRAYVGEVEYYGPEVLAYPGEQHEVQPMIKKKDFDGNRITGNPFKKSSTTSSSESYGSSGMSDDTILLPVTEK